MKQLSKRSVNEVGDNLKQISERTLKGKKMFLNDFELGMGLTFERIMKVRQLSKRYFNRDRDNLN